MDEAPDDLQVEVEAAQLAGAAKSSPAVLIAAGALLEMNAHAAEEPEHEIGGIMLGSVIQGTGLVVIVEDVIRGTHMTHSRGSVTFTHESWAEINRLKDERFADKQIVGWYHSHPGFGIFLSNHDLFIHQNFFTQPWQLAFVTDPRAQTCGCFVWDGSDIVPDQDFAVLSSPAEYLGKRPNAPEGPKTAAELAPDFALPRPTPVLQRDQGLNWALGVLALLVALAAGLSLTTYGSARQNAAAIQALDAKLDTLVQDIQQLRSAKPEVPAPLTSPAPATAAPPAGTSLSPAPSSALPPEGGSGVSPPPAAP